jgi:predicted TIM-barrel fold metal-dependent hydrolase
VHALAEVADEGVYRVPALARAFPDLPMVVVDPFSSNEQGVQVMAITDLAPNLIFDVSGAVRAGQIESFIHRFGCDRIVFGTDLYSHPFDFRLGLPISELAAMDVPERDLAAMFSGTIRRVLAL